MSKLPIGNLEWMTSDELLNFDINKVDLDGNIGYIIECDLLYPSNLHKLHHNLPLAPEVLQIDENNLSSYAKKALLESNMQSTYKDVKLMSTFYPRKNYILHGKTSSCTCN